ncbi:Fpg/Nei family DNA glycosylase [Mycobacterium avium]|uniref:Fpg/Nei family DNA glycosylase n=1 Tax=Mycobacterium avium TaxID=1764 RepID=UPI0001B5A36F|nr:DNA-formamidopyrimidine glycosylase family protein [Mycobacterium avium]ANR93051.1 formamidopyrimidine-DNA glycosylase [Mycobacterium avium]AYJ04501.1 Fpg/Nei family DNA glycosylase [Mycobacterium avium]MDV3266381.1 Fpg/Nei family DNA glycosylase [Mycobacterium avium]QGW31544.1 Formamidopyrimidine-DNA glycosylase [Mycobacterium avium subsp. avium]UEA18562.1 Fpg/Nei family DNA glycosylase [Mycobacterium avium subsp. avium]
MPELPDVEGFRRQLADALPGRRVRRVKVHDPGILRNTTATTLARRLTGRRFAGPRRHGKWLVLPTDGPTLLIHSGMTGRPYYCADGAAEDRHQRLVVSLDQGELRYTDLRKLRGVWLADDPDDLVPITGRQGPDALGLGLLDFRDALTARSARRRQLKSALMDQSVLAGLGNLLVDEICWRARIRPTRAVADLDDDEVKALHRAMTQVLRTAVRHGRVPGLPRWLTGARDAPNPHCPRCGARLDHARVGGRTTLWCPRCQPG